MLLVTPSKVKTIKFFVALNKDNKNIIKITDFLFYCEGSGGIYNDAQVEGWKKVVDKVHGKGGLIAL